METGRNNLRPVFILRYAYAREGLVGLQKRIDFHVILLEAGADVVEGLVHAIGELQHLVLVFVDRAPVDHGLPVENFVPIPAAVDEDDVVLGELARLQQREHLPELIHRAKAAGKDDEGFGDLREPQFAHEEIMKIEAELRADVGVGELLVGELDREADGFAAGFDGAAIGSLHDAWTAPGANDEAARLGSKRQRPGSNLVGEMPRFLVITGHFEKTLGVADFAAVSGLRH